MTTTPGIYPKGAVPAHRASYNGALHEGERADCRLCDVHEATHQPEGVEPEPVAHPCQATYETPTARTIRQATEEAESAKACERETAADLAAERAAHEEHRRQLATALGQDGDADWPYLLRRAEQIVTARITWKNTAANLEADRDRLAAELAAARTSDAPWIRAYREDLTTARQRAKQAEDEVKRLGLMVDDYATGARQISDKLRAERDVAYQRLTRARRAEATLTRVRDAVAEAKACGGEDAGCTVDHRDIITNLIDNGTAALGDDQPTPDTPEVQHCCVCGSTHVAYRNYQQQPFCGPCADCGCGQTPCARTGINDPAVSSEAAEAETPEPSPTVHVHLDTRGAAYEPWPQEWREQPAEPRLHGPVPPQLVISLDIDPAEIAALIRRFRPGGRR